MTEIVSFSRNPSKQIPFTPLLLLKLEGLDLNGIIGVFVKVIPEKWELVVRKVNSLFLGFWGWIGS